MKRIIAFCIVITFLCHRHCGKWHDDAEKVSISNLQCQVSEFTIYNFERLNCVMDPSQEKIIQNISYTQKYSTCSCGQYLFTRHILIGMRKKLFFKAMRRDCNTDSAFSSIIRTTSTNRLRYFQWCRFKEFSNYRNQSFILYSMLYIPYRRD